MATPIQFPQRKQQAGETRSRLLDTAWEMVRADGAAGFTMRKLAQKASVAVGLPFAYFKSRELLLDELRMRVWDEIDQAALSALASLPSPTEPPSFERLARTGLLAAVQYSLDHPRLYDLIALNPGERLTDAVLARELQTAQPFVSFLLQGREAREFDFHGDPIVFALALWSAVQGYIQRLGAQTPEMFRSYQEAVLAETLEAFFSRIRRKPLAASSAVHSASKATPKEGS